MYCPHCGSQLWEDSPDCSHCGRGTAAVATAGDGAAVAMAPERHKVDGRRIIIGIAAAASMIAIIWWLAIVGRKPNVTFGSPLQSQPQPGVHQYIATLPQESLRVAANAFYATKIIVPAGATSVRLEGDFRAVGGSGNDINCYVLTEDNFANWENHNQVGGLYVSGRVSHGRVQTELPNGAGTYWLVFSNKFSFLSSKDVDAQITLSYQTAGDKQ